jgi:hypothetical protein
MIEYDRNCPKMETMKLQFRLTCQSPTSQGPRTSPAAGGAPWPDAQIDAV